MLKSVELRNFKSFLHRTTIELEPLTVFVGANASGKSSILDAVWIAIQITLAGRTPSPGIPKVDELQRPDWDLESLYTRGAQGDFCIKCIKGNPNGRTIGVATRLNNQSDKIEHTSKLYVNEPPDPLPGSGAPPAPFDYGVPRPEYLKLSASKLARATYLDQYPPHISMEGEGLASVLAHMALSNHAEFDELIVEMRRLIPQFEGIRFTKQKVQRTETELIRFGDEPFERQTRRDFQGDAIRFDFQNAKDVSANLVSEGTLILMGLLTVLSSPARPDLLLVDDMEQGLHPLAQKGLIEVLGKVMNRFPSLQILATAHSPYLLDWLRPEQVRLTAIGPDGYSVCGKLTNHPQFSKWKDEMAPGELWSLFGEKWVTEGGSTA